jgi:hypothetical protein
MEQRQFRAIIIFIFKTHYNLNCNGLVIVHVAFEVYSKTRYNLSDNRIRMGVETCTYRQQRLLLRGVIDHHFIDF